MKAHIVYQECLGIVDCRVHIGNFFREFREMLELSTLGRQSDQMAFEQFTRFKNLPRP
jgi:hypothetical protein